MPVSSLLLGGAYSKMTSFFSVAYAVFLAVCILLYALLPQKVRKYFLFLASCCFFWLVSGKLIIYLLLSILSIHYFGIWLDRIHMKRDMALKAVERVERKSLKKTYLLRSRMVILLAVLLHVGVLLVLKYSPFAMKNINVLLEQLHLPLQLAIPDYLLPIGISFFTLQALSYLFDVYRETEKADDNILRLALWMSFFPQIVEGPICRYSQTANQLWNVKQITYTNLTLGAQRILYGLMKKIVIADRLNPLIQSVFSNYAEYEGGMIALAAVCYTIQLYMDFSGTMDAVAGTAQIFGVTMPENFQRPFFSKSISEFWKRWHITLGTWFRDYVFYPVATSKPMKNLTSSARKKLGNHFGPLLAGGIALFCVWFCNGLWHGAAWNYLFFGMYHFALILMGNIMMPAVVYVNQKLHIHPKWMGYRLLQIIRTGILVVIGELFFRAHGLRAGLAMFQKMITDFRFPALTDDLFGKLGVDQKDFLIIGITLMVVFVVSLFNERGVCIRTSLKKRNVVLRWACLYAIILYIIIFGAYGSGYVPVDPMYANF